MTTKFIEALKQEVAQARADYERQWELYPGFDEESKAKRMQLALHLVDAEENLKDAEFKLQLEESRAEWEKKRARIKAEFEASLAI